MASGPTVDGVIVTREAYLRSLTATAEQELALLDQGEEILGLLAGLLALDARELELEVELDIADAGGAALPPRPTARDAMALILD